MAFKTYLPALLAIMHQLCKYMIKYETQIKSHLPTDGQKAAFDALLAACMAFRAIYPAIPVGD